MENLGNTQKYYCRQTLLDRGVDGLADQKVSCKGGCNEEEPEIQMRIPHETVRNTTRPFRGVE